MAVVPVLTRLIEDRAVGRVLGTRPDDRFEIHAIVPAGRRQFIELVDIGFVMPAVMEFERLGGHVRRQRIDRVRQGRELKQETILPFIG